MRNIFLGIVSGIVAGVVYTFFLAQKAMLPGLGQLIFIPSISGGLLAHNIVSLVVGILFALVFFRVARGFGSGILWGMLTGTILWVVGPMILMPFLMKAGWFTAWTEEGIKMQLPSLVGHLAFGFVLGGCYGILNKKR